MANARDAIRQSYGDVRYPFLAHRHTDPDRLATIARLHGIVTPPVERCRLLEVGCALGGNLASMAMLLPNAQLIGFDLSEEQIEEGRAAMTAAGIDNVSLCALDIEQVGTSLGKFDYIVAHGVFSWVPDHVQDALLALLARCLAPNGVAYLSCNVRPGWHEGSVIRDAMMFDLRGIETPRARLDRAREYLRWLLDATRASRSYGPSFLAELEEIHALDDLSLFHEYLGPINVPLHFHKLIARAERYGLSYLCDAEPALSADHSPTPDGVRARQRSPDELVFAEQHYDFLTNHRFRRVLFCRRGASLTRTIDARLVDALWVSSRGRPNESAPSVAGPEPLTFSSPESELTTARPLMKAALVHLATVAPRAIPFVELREAVQASLGGAPLADADVASLREDLVQAFLSSVGMVTLRTYAPPCVTDGGERPVATAWVRWLAAHSGRVPNLDHDMVRVDGIMQKILPMLDGTRDRATLESELMAMVARNEVTVRLPDGRPGKPAPGAMNGALSALARSALLVG